MSGDQICCYCKESFQRSALRPYGPGGARICFECGTSPEHLEMTKAAFAVNLEAAKAISPLGSVVIGGDSGPEPLLIEDPQ